MDLELELIDGLTNNSPKIFGEILGEILASFRESHYRCQDKQQLVSKLDRLALDFRQLSNICATLVDRASDWCENCTVLLECVAVARVGGNSAETHNIDMLSEEMFVTSEKFSKAFEDIKKFTHKFMVQLDNGLVDLYNKEEEQAKAAEHEAKNAKHQAVYQDEFYKQNRSYAWSWSFRSIPDEDQKLKQEMESAEKKFEAAKDTLSDVSDQKQKVLHLVENTKTIMKSLEETSESMSKYFSKEAIFYKQIMKLSIENAKKKTAEVKQLKNLFDTYYREMVLVTSNYNFVPCSNLPRSEFQTVELFGMQFSFQ